MKTEEPKGNISVGGPALRLQGMNTRGRRLMRKCFISVVFLCNLTVYGQFPKSHLAFHAYYSLQMATTNLRDSTKSTPYMSFKIGANAKLRLKDSALSFLNLGFFYTQKGI